MAVKIASSLSCVFSSLSSSSQSKRSSQVSFRRGLFGCLPVDAAHVKNANVGKCQFISGKLKVNKVFLRQRFILFALDDQLPFTEIRPDGTDQEEHDLPTEERSPLNSSYIPTNRNDGRPGFISFYNRPYERESEIPASIPQNNQSTLLWFVGPAILVSSFIFPSLYLRRILSTIFEDSLLTDFLILFFTEALFYCGVAVFLLIVDHLRRANDRAGETNIRNQAPQLEYRITSVAVLVLSLMIPMVTMGLVWPWTGPAASATLAPYLVGIIVQFAFEQYAKYVTSPSWPVIPVIFQVYRLHQLNRAAQLVTALSFTVRGAEMTSHNLAINSSLGTLLNVLQCLGVICIWSLSSFLMRYLPFAAVTE